MDPMSAGWEAFFFCAAFVCLALAALEARIPVVTKYFNIGAAGLALFVFVFAWNALADA